MERPEPRPVTPEELEQLAIATAENVCLEPLDGPTDEDLQTQRDFLSGAAIAAWDRYTTDSPGYQGTVYAVIWPGGPELVTSYYWEHGAIKEAH